MSANTYGYKVGESVVITGGVWQGEKGVVTAHDIPGVPVHIERFPGTEYFEIGPAQVRRELPESQLHDELTKAAHVMIGAMTVDPAVLTVALKLMDTPLAQALAPLFVQGKPFGVAELNSVTEGMKLTLFFVTQVREHFDRMEAKLGE